MLWIIVGVIVVTVAIYAMVSISASNMEKSSKMMWFAIVVLIPLIGPLSYYLLRKNPTEA
ncbi:MAG: PLD nuclease N-terminal domain-containing protein [Cyclobacteriaceae bacterium]